MHCSLSVPRHASSAAESALQGWQVLGDVEGTRLTLHQIHSSKSKQWVARRNFLLISQVVGTANLQDGKFSSAVTRPAGKQDISTYACKLSPVPCHPHAWVCTAALGKHLGDAVCS